MWLSLIWVSHRRRSLQKGICSYSSGSGRLLAEWWECSRQSRSQIGGQMVRLFVPTHEHVFTSCCTRRLSPVHQLPWILFRFGKCRRQRVNLLLCFTVNQAGNCNCLESVFGSHCWVLEAALVDSLFYTFGSNTKCRGISTSKNFFWQRAKVSVVIFKTWREMKSGRTSKGRTYK